MQRVALLPCGHPVEEEYGGRRGHGSCTRASNLGSERMQDPLEPAPPASGATFTQYPAKVFGNAAKASAAELQSSMMAHQAQHSYVLVE